MRNMRKILIMETLILIIIFLFTSTVIAETTETRVFRFAMQRGIEHDQSRALLRFSENVERLTGGSIKIKIYFDAVLGDHVETLESTQLGIIEGARVASGNVSSRVHKLQTLDLPFLFEDSDRAFIVLNDFLVDRLEEDFAEAGLVALGYYQSGFRDLTCVTKPIQHPDQLKGMRFRVPGIPAIIETFKEFGASPVIMDSGELLLALRTGAVDGQDNNAWGYRALSLQD